MNELASARGRFIVIEGMDGAGTTTQAERLVRTLRGGRDVVRTFEPTDGLIGTHIRALLRRGDPDVNRTVLPFLFTADRALHLANVVEPAVARGAIVVSDRYTPSSYVYQGLDHPWDLVDGLNRPHRVPDLTVYIRVSVDVALERIMARGGERDVFETRETLTRVAELYEATMRRLANRSTRGWSVVEVDGDAEIDVVAAEVLQAVSGVLPPFEMSHLPDLD